MPGAIRRQNDVPARTGTMVLRPGGVRSDSTRKISVRRRLEMRALVYHGPGRKSWDEVPDPTVQQDTDAIVQVDTVTICGTDLHILKGDVPAVTDGRILGHEAVGTVVEVGAGVKNVCVGDRILVSCITACGRCRFCRGGHYGQCVGGGGWILGHRIDGTQAEYVRVPFADNSTYSLPAGVSNDQALMLADILPTGYEVGVLNGAVQPADTVAVVGAGPIGLAAILGAKLFTPSHVVAIDLAAGRLEAAKQFGADVVINSSREDPVAELMRLTNGLGADVAIEAVGIPDTFELCTRLIRPGGRVANIGVHGKPATLHLEELWIKNITITTGLVDTYSTPALLGLVAGHQIDSARLITHHFALGEFMQAYDTFARAGETGALKVILNR
ncbi:zinc-dependent alcohol dehydrogenase family protein [Micromonospora sp. CPCC 206060]|uniref:zinc-dependent alcohol dehydrogenase family protein n=1 Tax=Micromonospora sp. CPCC 206060 TaxID=3122406 RepID=UPI002FEFD767